MTMADTISMETSSSRAMSARSRVESRMPPRPSTRVRGIPDCWTNRVVRESTGSVAMITVLCGARRGDPAAPGSRMSPAFTVYRSSRRIPGVRMAPAAITTICEPSMSSRESEPLRVLR